MRSRSTLGVTRNEAILTAIIVVLTVALIVVVIPKPTTPTLQVSGVSLSPSTISQNASATLSFRIKNNDATNPHLVSVFFDETTSWNVTVYLGNVSLTTGIGFSSPVLNMKTHVWSPAQSEKTQFYHMPQIQPSQDTVFNFRVTGTLSGGASTSTYSISFYFTDENLTRFDNETVSLTVLQ
jgi:hypothetical protein